MRSQGLSKVHRGVFTFPPHAGSPGLRAQVPHGHSTDGVYVLLQHPGVPPRLPDGLELQIHHLQVQNPLEF